MYQSHRGGAFFLRDFRMLLSAMEPFGRALSAYFEGSRDAELIIRRDDGKASPVPVSLFFRGPSGFSTIDKEAIRHSTGRSLDVGGGTGVHSLVLQDKGLPVTAIDICPQAVDIMKRRGVREVQRAAIFDFSAGSFDTLLLMGHGIGMVESMAGLKRFFACARALLANGGSVLLESLDVRCSTDPADLAYHQANEAAGRYVGEIRMRFEFEQIVGEYCGWLHIDADTLTRHAAKSGWRCETIYQGEHGDYLARLSIDHKV